MLIKNLTGRTFGRLTVLHPARKMKQGTVWKCSCSCGNTSEVFSFSLLGGQVVSCGCLNREKIKTRSLRHGDSGGRGPGSRAVEYTLWSAMKDRCLNPNNKQFKDYGGRGITVCSRWLSYENFLEDVGRRPDPALTLERIDNKVGYEPGNVRWATRVEQQANMRTNRVLTYKGKTQHIAEWAREFGLTEGCLNARIRMGWSVEKALLHPVRPKRSQ